MRASAQNQCTHIFRLHTGTLSEIGYTQDFIGFAWALVKLDELREKYRIWQEENPSQSAFDFVYEKTRKEKPLPAIRDISGQIRLIDKHHTVFTYFLLLGGDMEAQVAYSIEKDYTKTNKKTGSSWSPEEFMADLIERNWVSFDGNDQPTWADLQSLPRKPTDLHDNPARSLLSMTLRALPVPIKGSDLMAHGQNSILDFLRPKIQDLSHSGAEVVTPENVDLLKDMILESEIMLENLKNLLSPKIDSDRKEQIENFIDDALKKLD